MQFSSFPTFLHCSKYLRSTFFRFSTAQFSCDETLLLERIILSEQCGVLLSPCYPENYPEDLANGIKIWDINANGASDAPVVGK